MKVLARIGLTLFAWFSALAVAFCGVLAAGGSEVALMAAGRRQNPGLAYRGGGGAALAFLEAVLVLLAWRAARRAHGPVRLLGASALLAWACLWSAGALRWSLAEPEPLAFAVGACLLLSLACALAAFRQPREG